MFAYERRACAHPHRWTIWRSSTNRVVGGVCGGLGAHYNVSTPALRVGLIVLTVMTFPVMFIVYGLCVLIMPSGATEQVGSRRGRREPPPMPQHAMDYDDLEHEYDRIEARIRTLEDHVTSREYVLKRKFESL